MAREFSPVQPAHLLPVGSVVAQRRGGRTFLIVQEAPDVCPTIESWEDGIELTGRILGRLKQALDTMNADMSTFIAEFAAGVRETGAKIADNQRLLDEIIEGHA